MKIPRSFTSDYNWATIRVRCCGISKLKIVIEIWCRRRSYIWRLFNKWINSSSFCSQLCSRLWPGCSPILFLRKLYRPFVNRQVLPELLHKQWPLDVKTSRNVAPLRESTSLSILCARIRLLSATHWVCMHLIRLLSLRWSVAGSGENRISNHCRSH